MRLKDEVPIITGSAHGTADAGVVSIAAALATQSAFAPPANSRASSWSGVGAEIEPADV